MNILIPNLGSTSLKYQILEMPAETVLAKGRLERVRNYTEAIAAIRSEGVRVDAVAFKAVHAGPRYRGTYLIDDAVMRALEEFLPAAPLHNSIYLAGIRAFQESMPRIPLVAAFETEFHATLPDRARLYGVPRSWRDAGVERYGFHGASHQYVSERVGQLLGRPVRLISCHLGGSSSVCAVDDGRSIDTSMGFSPQSGLENATRPGDVDLFAALFMMEREGWAPREVSSQLAAGGGLAGLSEVPGGDLRDLEAAARSGSARASSALDLFAYQVRKYIGAYAAAMCGVDAIAFTGGIGENSASLRAACCRGLGFLGIELDPGRNGSATGDRLISRGAVSVFALSTNEEVIVSRRAFRLLSPD